MNKKGFTLIELLAVIIILGILMIIAIPSVTRYISDSRKNAYIDTAKEIVGGARNMVNEGKLEMYDTDATYYIESSCIKTENASKSPYGDFTKAYVVVTYDGKGYTYYWTSNDDAGQGIKDVIRVDKLDTDNVESDLKDSEISTLRGIDGRSKTIVVSKQNGCQKEGANDATSQVNGETGEERNPITYPNGKDKDTVNVGEVVKINNEEFYVLKKDNNDLYLLAKHNLKVGNVVNVRVHQYVLEKTYSESDEGYGLQNSICLGESPAGYPYHCTIEYDRPKINNYLDNYKNYLQQQGAVIKNIRLMSYSESSILTSSIVRSCAYWLNELFPNSSNSQYVIDANTSIIASDVESWQYYGVRPVIVI